MTDYYVRLVALPRGIDGVTVPNTDGTFDVYINSRLSPRHRKETLEHEVSHIGLNHFSSHRSITVIEREAEGDMRNPVLYPPTGKLPCFLSESAMAGWILDMIEE